MRIHLEGCKPAWLSGQREITLSVDQDWSRGLIREKETMEFGTSCHTRLKARELMITPVMVAQTANPTEGEQQPALAPTRLPWL